MNGILKKYVPSIGDNRREPEGYLVAVQKGAFLEGETAGQETRERLPVLREPESAAGRK